MDNLVAQFSYIYLHPEQSHRGRARRLGISHNSDKKYESIIGYQGWSIYLLPTGWSICSRLDFAAIDLASDRSDI